LHSSLPLSIEQTACEHHLKRSEYNRCFGRRKCHPLTFDVNAKDPDSDPIQLYGIGQGFNLGSVGISWSNKNGIASLTSPFQWNLTCELLGQEKEKIRNQFCHRG
jgi:acyl-CoA-binding protein